MINKFTRKAFSSKLIGQQVPSMMKFMNYDKDVGRTSVRVEECETPYYDKRHEVLIRVVATGLNRADLL